MDSNEVSILIFYTLKNLLYSSRLGFFKASLMLPKMAMLSSAWLPALIFAYFTSILQNFVVIELQVLTRLSNQPCRMIN